MLIDFTIANYRSIKEPVTLSAIATPQRTLKSSPHRRDYVRPDNEIAKPFEVEGRGFSLLPVLGLFGPNASGKSNVLRALTNCILYLTLDISEANFLRILFSKFRLDEVSARQPTCFTIRVAINHVIYSYSLEFDFERIYQERLEYIPYQKQQRLLFWRQWDVAKQQPYWKNGPDFAGPHKLLQNNWQVHKPFLSLFIDQMHLDTIEPLIQWLLTSLRGLVADDKFHSQRAQKRSFENPAQCAQICEFIKQFDTGLSDVVFEHIEKDDLGKEEFDVIAIHEHEGKEVRWLFQEESQGTQHLFTLADQILHAFEYGSLMVRDELEASLHPHITRAIIRMFQSEKTNPKRAQLVFTSHDYMLQSRGILRRDQIWYTRKRPDHSTELYSLSEFKERNDKDIASGYFEGRYGAVPILFEDELISLGADKESEEEATAEAAS